MKALTNKQLKMYPNQKGPTICRSKAELIDQVLTRARGNLSARDAVDWDEESPNSCEDDTNSSNSDDSSDDSESGDSDDSSSDSSRYVEESFEVMFVPVEQEEELQQVNESMERYFFQGERERGEYNSYYEC